MATPSASRLSSFYPTPSESTNTIAQAVCNSGQLTIQANSKRFGQSSDFIVSSPNLMDVPHLDLSVTIPKYTQEPRVGMVNEEASNLYVGSYHAGWGFDAIDRMEVTFSNSNISNLQITGHAMREWSLLQCKDKTEREQLLDVAGRHQVLSRDKDIIMRASVPLSFLFWRSAGCVKTGFPIDGRALNGTIIFRIQFANLNRFIGPHASKFNPSKVPDYPSVLEEQFNLIGGASPTYKPVQEHGGITDYLSSVTGFTDCNLTFRTYQLMDGAFSVSKALEANPGYVYSLPSLWMNTYSQEVNLAANGSGKINLNSAPAGMIQAMILRIRPTNPQPNPAITEDGNNWGRQEDTWNSRLNYEPDNLTLQTLGPSVSEIVYRPYVPWSLPVTSLKLEYSGQAIFWARSKEELDQFYKNTFCDDLRTSVCGAPLHLSVVPNRFIQAEGEKNIMVWQNQPDVSSVKHETQSLIIPLMHDGNDIFRKRGFENLPHYSGSTLQLSFTVDKQNYYRSDGFDRQQFVPSTGSAPITEEFSIYKQTPTLEETSSGIDTPYNRGKVEQPTSSCTLLPSNRLQKASKDGTNINVNNMNQGESWITFNNNPNAEGAVAYNATGGKVTVDVTYVVASLFQITNGVAELQL